jgi:GNAT superfamily N-acetyltransferase
VNIELRPAGPGDAELMHRVSLQAWTGRVAANSSLYRETIDYVAGVLSAGGGFLLWIDGGLAGSVRYFPVATQPLSWEIKRLGVIAAHRGKALGALLMDAVHERAQAESVRMLQLGVRADQPRLVSFYAQLGYASDDSVTLSAQNPLTVAAITMSRRLAY